MGYSLIIGEHTVDDSDPEYTHVTAREEKHDDAPAFGEPTDYTNERWPSYTAWGGFIEAAGLQQLESNGSHPLIAEHPGWVDLKPIHLEIVREAKRYLETKMALMANAGKDDLIEEQQYYHNRVVWLEYWIDWALKNCTSPIFANS